MKAEEIIIKKITSAFELGKALTDEWITSNEYIFEEVDAEEAVKYLPSYMVYVLKTFRSDPQSMIYMQVLWALNEYSKCKDASNSYLGLWFLLTKEQRLAVMAFLEHLFHNQPVNIDADEIQKIIKRWGHA